VWNIHGQNCDDDETQTVKPKCKRVIGYRLRYEAARQKGVYKYDVFGLYSEIRRGRRTMKRSREKVLKGSKIASALPTVAVSSMTRLMVWSLVVEAFLATSEAARAVYRRCFMARRAFLIFLIWWQVSTFETPS
jgi:hypothetical protein